jgi:hypothetical protein
MRLAPRFRLRLCRREGARGVNDSKLIHIALRTDEQISPGFFGHVEAVNNDNVMMMLIELSFIKIL